MIESTTINDGGPAFPHDGQANYTGGMSLRDWLAGQALIVLIRIAETPKARDEYQSEEELKQAFAADAYDWADAMLAERAKGGSV